MLTLGPLNELQGVRHAFFDREGGVSQGIYASLNCGVGSGDDKAKVRENRGRTMEMLGLPAERLATLYQIHSAEVVPVTAPIADDARPRADAMVTATPGLALGILTADCAPVLLADAEAPVIGAAHAGWKGALGGVLEAVVAAMERLGARRERIVAGIGPCIGKASYEVGPEFPAPFEAQDPSNLELFTAAPREGHFLFDLKGYAARRLARLGLTEIQTLPCDTLAEEDRFFSYRRACLRGEPDYGRLLSAIALQP